MNTDHHLKSDVLAELAWEPMDNWHDGELAGASAWAAPGTTTVSTEVLAG